VVKNKISFAYASQILPGMAVNDPLLPQIWWRNIDSTSLHMIGLTLGVVIAKEKHVVVKVDLTHEDSPDSCINESHNGASQADHFMGYPLGRQEFIGVSTLHVGGVTIKKTGMYTLTVKILEDEHLLDEVETLFFVESLKEQIHG